MCGVFGLIGPQDIEQIKAAHRTIKHRGPDGEGYWFDQENKISFCHHRLAIVDLSHTGAQPMTSASGRYVLTYNGEIYNVAELKAKLQFSQWRGHSDTEVLVQCFEEWEVSHALTMIEGMFAFSLWDKVEKKLILVRDRLGEKPLYYGQVGANPSPTDSTFVFASELKPIISLFGPQLTLSKMAVQDFFTRSCIHRDLSIFNQIKKLPAASFVEIQLGRAGQVQSISPPKTYWSLQDIPLGSRTELPPGEAIVELQTKLELSIDQQKMSDVPLGAFLSGGVDSSLIAALMQKSSSQRIKTFSMGFYDKHYDEAKYARAVAEHLGTDHQELYVSEKELLEVIPTLSQVYDEPFADSSQIPTILVSQMAKRHVTVALSGDGGDELFAGYTRHQFAHAQWNHVQKIPAPFRKFAAAALESLPPKIWQTLFAIISSGVSQPHEKIYKLAGVLRSANMHEFYDSVSTHWLGHLPLSRDWITTTPSDPVHGQTSLQNTHIHNAAEMARADASWYLTDDILAKVDRGAMSQSLETRAPFLNKSVVELALGLPMNLKIRDGQSKWILRQILYQYVPKNLIERPKMGFSVPLDSWLRKELKAWAWDLINPQALANQNILDAKAVLQKWEQHQRGDRNWQTELWDILIFMEWRKNYKL